MATSLLNKLIDFVKAIQGHNLSNADLLLKEILAANESLSKPTKSLVKYYAEAPVRRVYKLYPRNPRPLTPSCTDLRANTDYLFSPFFWFAHFTTCDFVRDALIGKRRVHLIDFTLMVSGWRCNSLLGDISEQLNGPISFRLTTVGPLLSKNAEYLQETLERLPRQAKRLAIDFEVRHLVANSASDIVESALKLTRTSDDETIIVKWEFQLHKLLTITGAVEKVLSKLKELNPEIMIVVEQEGSHDGQNFLESYLYYSIIFESLEKDNFNDINNVNHCKVLWETYFRRQICQIAAQEGSTDQIERHETFAHWQEKLRRSGFRHVRLNAKHYNGYFLDHLPEYSLGEKDRHPVLCRNRNPLVVTSAWKPDPTQLNSDQSNIDNCNQESTRVRCDERQDGSSCPLIVQLDTENYSKFHENQPGDPHIMMEGIMWSKECFSINQVAASAEIFDMLEYICHVLYLPVALTWMSDHREGILHLESNACYLNDFTMIKFTEACAKQCLQEGKGVAGKALQSNSMYFVSDISKLDVKDYPLVFEAWDFGLRGVVAIKLVSNYMSSIDYVLELFLPPKIKELSAQRLLINEITSILEKNSRNSWKVCTEEFTGGTTSSEVRVLEVVGMSKSGLPAISGSPLASLSEIESLNSSEVREFCNVFDPTIDGACRCSGGS